MINVLFIISLVIGIIYCILGVIGTFVDGDYERLIHAVIYLIFVVSLFVGVKLLPSYSYGLLLPVFALAGCYLTARFGDII